jgi:YozE SAM-like fold
MTTNWTKNWLASARITDDPMGDLIADMRRDPNIPSLFKNIDAMRDYLRTKGACREAIAVVPKLWRPIPKLGRPASMGMIMRDDRHLFRCEHHRQQTTTDDFLYRALNPGDYLLYIADHLWSPVTCGRRAVRDGAGLGCGCPRHSNPD